MLEDGCITCVLLNVQFKALLPVLPHSNAYLLLLIKVESFTNVSGTCDAVYEDNTVTVGVFDTNTQFSTLNPPLIINLYPLLSSKYEFLTVWYPLAKTTAASAD